MHIGPVLTGLNRFFSVRSYAVFHFQNQGLGLQSQSFPVLVRSGLRLFAVLGCDTGTGDYRGIMVTGVTGTGTGSNI